MADVYQQLACTICRAEERVDMVSAMKAFIEEEQCYMKAADYEDIEQALDSINSNNGCIRYIHYEGNDITSAMECRTENKLADSCVILMRCNAGLFDVNRYLESITDDISEKSTIAIALDENMREGAYETYIWN